MPIVSKTDLQIANRELAEQATRLERERDELRSRVAEVERIGTKLQHDVAEAAGMNTLGEEAACTDLVVEAVRELRRERGELSSKLDETCAATADLAERLATLTRDHEALVTLYGAAKVERDELRDALAGLKAHPDTARVYLEAADEGDRR